MINIEKLKVLEESPEEYLNMIRPFLRDLINKHKPIEELNNSDNDTDNNNNNYDNNNDNDNNDNNTDRGEWIIQLSMIIRCISTKNFSEKRTMHSKSKAVEVYMGSDTEDVIDTIFNTLLQNFLQVHKKHQMNLYNISRLDSKKKSNNKSKK